MENNTILMGFKGKEIPGAGYVYCPYVPLHISKRDNKQVIAIKEIEIVRPLKRMIDLD